MADHKEHGPLEAYQWSAARLDQQLRFIKRVWIAFGSIYSFGATFYGSPRA